MNAKQFWKSCIAAVAGACLAISQVAGADDTDLFLINPAVESERPNVLIILDNTANWSPMFAAEKAALVSVVNGLTDQFNVGLMMFVETGGSGICTNGNTDGSYMRHAVRQMTTANKTKLSSILNGLDINNDKSNNAVYGLTMNEARQYFAGAAARSGGDQGKRDYSGNTCPSVAPSASGNAFSSSSSTTYRRPISDACQKNFIVFISNGKANDNAAASSTSNTLLSGLGGNTTTISLTPNGSESNTADEWARFLANNDQSADFTGSQTIITYTLLVQADGAPAGQYPDHHETLMKSMAAQGKGKFFKTDGTTTQITAALNKIFEEVQAVNSVFASSTLPVSVNVRGTFLNQVYMGVFRPDANSLPRWAGNLKQYKLAVNNSTNPPSLFLADRNGSAVENSVTGFVSPNATSIWSTSSTFWNSTYASAFYDYSSAQGAGGASDAPDGDLVEKGGAAQHLRASFASGRTVYTCAGGCASSGSTPTLFATTNSSVTATALGITGAQTISTLTRSGTTATATLPAAHGYTSGQFITISGASQSEYNGTFSITTAGPASTTFTYTVPVNPATPATGTVVAALPSAGAQAVTSLTRSGTTATATVPGHLFANGQTVVIAGADQSEYNGVFTISVVDTNTFTYTLTETPTTPADVSAATATVNGNSRAPTSIARSGTTVTVDVGTAYPVGQIAIGNIATIAGATPIQYNGNFTITSVAANRKSFTYTITLGPVTPATGIVTADGTALPKTMTSLTRSGTTATATFAAAHGIGNGATVNISGADQAAYNGTHIITTAGPASTTFTYTVTVTPATPATGTITSSSDTLNRDDLINWVRGKNVRQEDNPDNNANSVRGYIHGDVLHSRPAVFNYNRTGQPVDRDIMVFYGANDGAVHAVKGGNDDLDGDEKWAFILPEHFSRLRRLMEATPTISSSNPKPYFVDGSLSIYSKDGDNDERFETLSGANADIVNLYIGMRRGGRLIYALSVVDPDSPKFLWKKDNTSSGYFELGQTWSELKPFKIRGSANPVLIFGLGYDPTANDASPQGAATMGRGVMVVDATDGTPIWQAGPRDPTAAPVLGSPGTYKQVGAMTCSFPADLTVFDSDSDIDKLADRIYAVDTCGNVWRINIDDATPSNWTVGKLASIGGTGANERKFLFAPDVVEFSPTVHSVLVGSGDREHPFDTTVQNRFYMFKDDSSLNAVPSSAITESDLCDANAADLSTCMADAAKKGWFLPLSAGEKVVGGSTTLGGATFFGTNLPQSSVAAGTCTSGLGEARLYAVSFRDASPVLDLNASGGALTAEDRYVVRGGGGFPPTPIPIVTQPEAGGPKYEVVCTGTQCLTPPAQQLEKRYRIYWNMEVE